MKALCRRRVAWCGYNEYQSGQSEYIRKEVCRREQVGKGLGGEGQSDARRMALLTPSLGLGRGSSCDVAACAAPTI